MASLASREQILALAADLWSERDQLTLDEVDGSFYWRICRGDLKAKLLELVEVAKREGPGDVDSLQALSDHIHRMEQSIPSLNSWLWKAKPPAMRDPLFEAFSTFSVDIPAFSGSFQSDSKSSGLWVQLGVRNSQWRGEQVEHALRSEVKELESDPVQFLTTHDNSQLLSGESVSIVDLRYYAPGELRFSSESFDFSNNLIRFVPVESPVVLCTVGYPLPPEGIISATYNAVAIKDRAWHQQLYGSGVSRNQTVGVAIRTWVIGLLVGAGERWMDAQRRFYDLTGSEIAQPGFQADRANLITRVPEAKPFVFQRARRTT